MQRASEGTRRTTHQQPTVDASGDGRVDVDHRDNWCGKRTLHVSSAKRTPRLGNQDDARWTDVKRAGATEAEIAGSRDQPSGIGQRPHGGIDRPRARIDHDRPVMPTFPRVGPVGKRPPPTGRNLLGGEPHRSAREQGGVVVDVDDKVDQLRGRAIGE